MEIPASFVSAVEDNDITRVRVMLKNSILTSTNPGLFDEMLKLAETMPGLYDKFNNEPLPQDKSLWTEEFLAAQAAGLIANFCPERIQYVKEIVSYLSPPGQDESQPSSGTSFFSRKGRKSNYREQKEKDSRDGLIIRRNTIAYTCAGAGLGAIAGALASAAANTGTAQGALIGMVAGAIAGAVAGELRRA